MSSWLDHLRDDLEDRRSGQMLRGLHWVDSCDRLVRRDGRSLVNLAGNDYLGLASHPKLRDAVIDAAERWGVGSGASRLITGHWSIHERVERRFAEFKHGGASGEVAGSGGDSGNSGSETSGGGTSGGALLFPTGYMANLAVVTALAGGDDVVLLDKLNHASLIDAARASGAEVRTYPHGNLDRLKRLLERYRGARRRLIVTDAVFSMDGDCADLPGLCELRDRHDGILIVDEAHATGVLGERGAGLAEHQGVAGRIDVSVSTASKALGSMGGIVTAERVVIDTLVNVARSFIYTTAIPPTQAAAIGAALDVIAEEPERRARLGALGENLRGGLRANGWAVADDPTPIIPLIIGEAGAAVELSRRLEAAGFLVPAIRPPTVAPASARLRISLRADLLDEDVERLVEAVGRAEVRSQRPAVR